jgi:hypothetical protein
MVDMMQIIQHNEALEPALFRFSIAAFDRLCEEGIFADQRVELIDGLILDVAPMNDLHYKWLLELHDVLFLAMNTVASKLWTREKQPRCSSLRMFLFGSGYNRWVKTNTFAIASKV